MPPTKPVDVTIVYGFLGAGKTSLIRTWIPRLSSAGKTVLVVNEFGKEGVDQVVLASENLTVRSILGGCVCCEVRGELAQTLDEIRTTLEPDRIIIEPTGLAAPAALEPVFATPPLRDAFRIAAVVAVVDTVRHAAASAAFADFYPQQVRRSDVVVLNKIDLASPKQVDEARTWACTANPRATVVATTHGNVSIDVAVVAAARNAGRDLARGGKAPLPPYRASTNHEHHAHAGRLSTLNLERVVVRPPEMTREAVDAFVARMRDGDFGRVLRAKGFFPTPGATLLADVVMGLSELRAFGPAPARFEVIGRDLRRDEMEQALAYGFTELSRAGRPTA